MKKYLLIISLFLLFMGFMLREYDYVYNIKDTYYVVSYFTISVIIVFFISIISLFFYIIKKIKHSN